jgi:DNA-binding SARP family transcriptional activator/tetratricopeptide (TPR) repeat protein
MISAEPCDRSETVLRLAGSFTVLRDGTPYTGALGGRKARTLLKFLAVERHRLVPMDRIVRVLWPDTPPRRPAENVATLVSRVRTELGPDSVAGGREGYRLGRAPALRVDLDEASRLVGEAERRLAAAEPALARVAGGQALELLGTGRILEEEPYAAWAEPARTEMTGLLRRARHAAAEAALATADPATARAVAEAAVAADGFDEAAYRLLMRALVAEGQPAGALAVYESLRGRLAAELGADPAPQTREVHLAVLGGRPEPPPAVLAPRRPAAPPRLWSRPGDSPQFVGRDAEVDQVWRAWAAAAAGRPAVLVVAGEAGIGKTRLAAEAVRMVASTGGTVLQARCYQTERSLFLQPFVDALSPPVARMPEPVLRAAAGEHAAALAALLPGVATVLGPQPGERGTLGAERRRAFEALTAFLRWLGADGAVLVVLDDLHNAGLATVELLHYLARRLGDSRLLVLATVRAEEGEDALHALDGVAGRLDLEQLPAAAVAHLAAAAGQGGLTERILSRTRGHTLFVVETLRGLAAGESGVPESLQAAVLARLRRTGADTEELLRAASVLGAAFDPAVLADLLGVDEQVVAGRCGQALSARLLVVADREYEFANDLVREVLYATTPAPTRVVYHRRAADLLVRTPEAMAAHAAAAADWPRAARSWLLAGDEARRRFAAADADTLLGRALDAAERTGDLALVGRVYLARGRVREATAAYQQALADFRAAVAAAREVGDGRLEMLALRELSGDVPVALGLSMAESTTHLRAGLHIAESLADRAVEADLLARLAIISANRLNFTDAVSCGLRAVAAARSRGEERALAAALDGLKTGYAYLGEVDRLVRVLDELQPLLRGQGDLWRLQWAVFESSIPLLAVGDWDRAAARIDEAIELNRRSGYSAYQPWFVAHLGWVARLRGRYDEALGHGRNAVESAADLSHGWWRAAADALLAGTLLELGETAEAVALLEGGLRSCADEGAEAYLLRCLAPLAQATGSRAVLDQADELLLRISTPPGSAWLLGGDTYLAVARAWLGQGEPDRALAVLGPLLAAAGRTPWMPALAQCLLVAGRATVLRGEVPAAGPLLARAADLAARHHLPVVRQEASAALAALSGG